MAHKDQYDYLSERGSAGTNQTQRSILQANNEARMKEKIREDNCRSGGPMMPYEWDEPGYRTRQRYDRTVDYPGCSTHLKSEDDVI